MVGEETLVLCMVIATMAGTLIGFALGYGLKERKHADEMKSVMRIAKRIAEARSAGAKKERVPKDPAHYPSHRLPC
jgi:membrane protein YqaA with SNARE-associated domain